MLGLWVWPVGGLGTLKGAFLLRDRISAFAASLKMPAAVAALIVGIPVLVGAGLCVLRIDGIRINVDWIYYPTFAFVYAVWILPIIGIHALQPATDSCQSAGAQQKGRFICMVPAYNEERVIGNPMRSLLAQEYPTRISTRSGSSSTAPIDTAERGGESRGQRPDTRRPTATASTAPWITLSGNSCATRTTATSPSSTRITS